MRSNRLYVLVLLLLALALTIPINAQPPMPDIEGGEIVLDGLNGPQGILVDPDGNVWVIDAGVGGDEDINFFSPETAEVVPAKMGDSSRIIKFTPGGEMEVVATLPSVLVGTEGIGGARLALMDGNLYATTGHWIIMNGPDRRPLMGSVIQVGDEVTEVADTWAFEEANNPDGILVDTHPYGIAAGPDGWLWVADAGANSLIKVNPENGEIVGVTAFEGLPGPFPNPGRNDAMESDPVPTAVAFDADGNTYVSLLSGFPFIPGSAKVVQVAEDGTVSDYATGLTMLTDLVMGPDGEMYAVQFSMFTEEGPVMEAGSIIRVKEGDASEVVMSGLPLATSVAFDADGNGYVTIFGAGPPGSGAVVRIEGLTGMEGTPVAAGM